MLAAAPAAIDPALDHAIVGKPVPVARNVRSMFGFGAFIPQLQRIPEGVDVALPPVPQSVASAIPSRLGESVGEILSQTITGKSLNPLKAFETAAYGVAVEAVGLKDRKDGQGISANDDNKLMFWAPLLACAFVGGLKILEGRPDEIVEACQEKMVTFVAANYVLFPLASFCINNSIIPKDQRGLARQILTVVWNAWLATVGHSAVHSLGASSLVEEAADSLDLSSGGHVAVLAHAVGLSTLSQASPFLARAAEVVQGAAQLVEKLPSGLLEKMFSHSLDAISPLGQRSPSELLETAATLERICSSTLDPMRSSNLEWLWSGSV